MKKHGRRASGALEGATGAGKRRKKQYRDDDDDAMRKVKKWGGVRGSGAYSNGREPVGEA